MSYFKRFALESRRDMESSLAASEAWDVARLALAAAQDNALVVMRERRRRLDESYERYHSAVRLAKTKIIAAIATFPVAMFPLLQLLCRAAEHSGGSSGPETATEG